jgi:valyl-tRNA synthetase
MKAEANAQTNLAKFVLGKKQFVLLYILEEFLRILHPITPFVTEEIWQKLPVCIKDTGVNSILCTKHPTFKNVTVQNEIKQFGKWLRLFLMHIRSFRGSEKIKKNIILKIVTSDNKVEQENFLDELSKHKDVIFTLCRLVFVKNKLFINYELTHKFYVQNKMFYIF